MTIILGLTGPIASGKGTLADRLKSKGYVCISLSEEVRKEARCRGLPLIREVLQNIGDDLRIEFGNEILARRISKSIDELRTRGETQKIIIDGLRNPGEIFWLRKQYGMRVIGITADPEIRFQRVFERSKPSDPITREDFGKAEQRDRGIGQTESGHQVDACLVLADIVIENNGTYEELDENLQEILISFGIENVPRSKETF